MEKVALPCPGRQETIDPQNTIDALSLIPAELIAQNEDGISVEIIDVNPRLLIKGRTCDELVAWSARASTNKAEQTAQYKPVKGLIRYLMRKEHNSPFEMVGFQWRIAVPIFVARQLVRHRTAKLNEFSGRYSEMNEMWSPTLDRMAEQSSSNHQMSGQQLSEQAAQQILDSFALATQKCKECYQEARQTHNLAREIARTILPVSTMTYIVLRFDLRNAFHFIRLRTAPDAQKEIRVMAQMMAIHIRYLCPYAYQAFVDYQQESVNLSRMAIKSISDVIIGNDNIKRGIINKMKENGVSNTEVDELLAQLKL